MNFLYLLTPTIFGSFFIFSCVLSKYDGFVILSSRDSRISYLDGLRGIASVLVVCAHSKWIRDFGIINQEVMDFDFYFHTNMGSLGVQIFFCITSMLFTLKIMKCNGDLNIKNLYLSRLYRLVPLYIFWSILVVLICFLMGKRFIISDLYEIAKLFSFGFLGNNFNIGGLQTKMFTSAIWTLSYEWKFYLTLPAIAALYMSRKHFIPVVLLVIFIMFADMVSTGKNISIYFIIGMVASIIYSRININDKCLRYILSIIAYGLLIFAIVSKWQPFGTGRFFTIFLAFSILAAVKPKHLGSRPLVIQGEISYSIYLIHMLAIYLFSKATKALLYPFNADILTVFVIFFVLCLIIFSLSAISFRYIEFPFMQILSKDNKDR